MKKLFKREHLPDNEILFIQYGDCLFSISENTKGTYAVCFCITRQMNEPSTQDYISGSETLSCPKRAVEEAFDLLKRHCVMDLLEEIKQSEFRDIECYPSHTFTVRCDYAGFKYSFNDFYGCCYEKSCDPKTQLCMTHLMLNLAELFFLVQQGKL